MRADLVEARADPNRCCQGKSLQEASLEQLNMCSSTTSFKCSTLLLNVNSPRLCHYNYICNFCVYSVYVNLIHHCINSIIQCHPRHIFCGPQSELVFIYICRYIAYCNNEQSQRHRLSHVGWLFVFQKCAYNIHMWGVGLTYCKASEIAAP